MVEKPNGVSSDETSERVPSDAELLDIMAIFPQLLKSCLDFVRDSLAANFSAIVRKASCVALGDQDVKIRISLADACGEVLEVVRSAPKAEVVSGRSFLSCMGEARVAP